MTGLEAFQIPHDPRSRHQLHWQPGSHGKGLLAKDGTLHTWSVARQDGDPSHRRYMMESPAFNYDPYGPNFRTSDDHMYFWQDPEGNVSLLNRENEAESAKRINQIDPRLVHGDEKDVWKFGGTEDQARAIPDPDLDDWIDALVRSVSPPSAPETVEQAAIREQREKLGPIGYERFHDWDKNVGQGDTHTHPDVEWVPTHVLKQFMEYDRTPGGKDGGPKDRYEALRDHIKQHGFNNPIQLEANVDEGHAHMGEGNHRAAIALELGIPSMPVRVNRSTRTSPTQIPIDVQHHTFPTDHQGNPWPTHSMKPSQIGLPTVPPPG